MSTSHAQLNLSGLGYREMAMVADVLNLLSEGLWKVHPLSSNPMMSEQLTLGYNPYSDKVYLFNEEGGEWLVNDDGNLENYISCPNCGREGFKSSFEPKEGCGACHLLSNEIEKQAEALF